MGSTIGQRSATRRHQVTRTSAATDTSSANGGRKRRTAILTMDGGGPNNLLTTILLMRIETARPGFLDGIDVISGVSAGSITALILGSQEDRRKAMLQAFAVMNDLGDVFDSPMPILNALAGLTGESAFISNAKAKKFFSAFFHGLCMKDLAIPTIIPTFQLDGQQPVNPHWRPVLLHNLAGVRNPDSDLLVVDALLRSAAPPILMPVYQGCVDGGLFADNPSAAALTLVLEQFRLAKDLDAPHGKGLEDVMLLSLGTGNNPMAMPTTHESENWGYRKWLFDFSMPMAAIMATFAANQEFAALQCRSLLAPDQYFRLNPNLKKPIAPRGVTLEDKPSVEEVAWAADLGPVLAWVDQSGWLSAQPQAAEPPPPAA